MKNIGAQSPCLAWSNFPWHDWVAGVRMGADEHLSNKSQYTDNSLIAFEAAPGQTLSVELTTGFSWETFDENWRIWADFDQNGLFDEPSELLFEAVQSAPVNGTLTEKTVGSLKMPASAPIGQFRLRVAMRRGVSPEPCGAMDFGEIEDFSLKISGPAQPPAPCDLKADVIEAICIDSLSDAYRLVFETSGSAQLWTAQIGGKTFSGPVGTAFALPDPLKISDGEWVLRIADAANAACRASDKAVPPAPCAPVPAHPTAIEPCPSQSSFPWHDWIGKVKVAGDENASAKSTYSDFSSDGPVFRAVSGGLTTVELTAGFSWAGFQERWKIWIDLNQNGLFEEPNELFARAVMAAPASGTKGSTIATSIALPSGLPDQTYRMRVSMCRNDWPGACGGFHYGEVEDYSLQIEPDAATAAPIRFGSNAFEQKNEEKMAAAERTTTTLEGSAHVFPNPATGQQAFLFFKNETSETQTATVELFDEQGRLAFSKKSSAEPGPHTVELPLEGLADGLYFWKIWQGQRAESGRLAVKG